MTVAVWRGGRRVVQTTVRVHDLSAEGVRCGSGCVSFACQFGLQANVVEEYPLLSALLHVGRIEEDVGHLFNYSVVSGKLNIAILGVMWLAFMAIHLFQFRFGATQPHDLYLPGYLVNIWPGITCRGFFWLEGPCKPVPVLDNYRLKFEVFASLGWVLLYIEAVCVFITHMCLNWVKVVGAPALGTPRKYQNKAVHICYVMTVGLALIYVFLPDLSTPVWCRFETGRDCEFEGEHIHQRTWEPRLDGLWLGILFLMENVVHGE